MRKTGIEIIGEAPWGTHFCQFYETRRDLSDILVPYFRAGLEQNEFCMWVTSSAFSKKQAEAALREATPNFDTCVQKGQIEILPYSDWYLQGGSFDLHRVLRGWVTKLEQALANGFSGLRLSGNTVWLEKKDWQSFTEYEAAINQVIGQYPMMALCTYSLKKCSAVEILDVVRNHQFALVRGKRGWELIESSEHKTARDSLRETERRFQSLFNAMTEGFALHEVVCDSEGHPCDYRFLAVNPAFEQLTGLRRKEVIGKTVLEVMPTTEPEWIQTYGRVALTGEPAHFERYSGGLDRHYEVFAYRPAPGQFACVFLDITERQRTERRLDLLAETAGQLLQSDSPQSVVDVLCQKVMAFLGCQVFFNYLVDGERQQLQLNAYGGIPREEARRIEWLDFGAAVCGCAARDGCRIVAEDIAQVSDARTDLVRAWGIQAYACHPLVSGGRVLGTLSFGTRMRSRFSADDLALMKTVADLVAIAMERQRTKAALQLANQELEQRVAERTAEVQEKTRFLEAFFHHSLDSLVFLDKDFRFIRVNEAYARACHREVSDFPGHNHFEFYPHPENQAIFENVVRTKTPYLAVAKPFVFPDHPEWGTTYWDWALVPVLDQQGIVDFLVFSLRDVTRREQAQQEVRAASRYARSLLESSLDPLVTISPQGKITDVNAATERVTGRTREHLVGSDFSSYFTEPPQAAVGYQKVLKEGLVQDYPLTIRHASGRTTDVLYNASVYRNETGSVQGVFAAARDVTELRAAQRRRDLTTSLLELSAGKTAVDDYLRSAAQVIQRWTGAQCLGIRVVDEEGNVPYRAAVGFELEFLRLESRLSLRTDSCCCTRAIAQAAESQDQPLLTPSGSFRCDDTFGFVAGLSPDQRARYRGNCMKFGFASLAIIPIRYRDRILGAVHLADRRPGHFPAATVEFIESMTPLVGEALLRFQAEAELNQHREHLEELVRQRTRELQESNTRLQLEIAERKHAEATLQQTAQELSRSNQDLEQFAYVASHDLQEPLRAVAGYVSLLERRCPDTLDEKGRHYIAGAIDGATRMQMLIHDLLAFSRVGTQGKTFAPADLAEALTRALRNLQASLLESGAKVTQDPTGGRRARPTAAGAASRGTARRRCPARWPGAGPRPPRWRCGADRPR